MSRSRLGAARLVLLALAAGAACQIGAGGREWTVVRSTPRGPYLDVQLAAGDGDTRRTFAPITARCRFVLEQGARVRISPPAAGDAPAAGGAGERYVRRDASCGAAGVGEARLRASAAASGPVPRQRAEFRLLYEDAEVVLLRGHFPMAERVGWATPDDVVVVVPNSAVCRTPVERGYGGMNYDAAADAPLSLVGRGGLCPIVGLVAPRDG